MSRSHYVAVDFPLHISLQPGALGSVCQSSVVDRLYQIYPFDYLQAISSFYERYSFIFNGSYKLADWITANSNFNYNRANWRSMPGSQDNEGNYFGRIMSLPPTVRYEDEDGNPVLGPNHSDGNQSYQPEKWLVNLSV